MMRSLGILPVALILLLSMEGNVLAQTELPEDWGKGFTDVSEEPHEIIPLENLIRYPEEARINKIEGKVTLQACVEKNGTTSRVQIVKSSDTIFNQEAIRVMKIARFKPGMLDSIPLKLWITRTINFSLKDKAQPLRTPRLNAGDSTTKLKH
jgi:TonB family protein